MRLLSANLCMISSCGCVQHAVPLAVGGLGISVAMLLGLSPLRAAVLNHDSLGGAALLLYSLRGIWASRGTWWAAPPSLLALAWLKAREATGNSLSVRALGWFANALAVYGYLFLSMSPLSQLATFVARRLFPVWVEDGQPQRRQLLSTFFGDYDVLCLQELTVTWGQDQHVREVLSTAADAGLVHTAAASRWPVFPSIFANCGLAIASRYPIVQLEQMTFSSQAWFEWNFVSRGALLAELELPGGKRVAVLNIHTTSGLDVLQAGLGFKATAENPEGLGQILEALQRFARFAPHVKHRIFCGDFNLPKDSQAFGEFSRQAALMGLHDTFPDSPATFGCSDPVTGVPAETLLTKNADRRNPRVLDHVFSTKPCASALVEPLAAAKPGRGPSPFPATLPSGRKFEQVSDHRAVAVNW